MLRGWRKSVGDDVIEVQILLDGRTFHLNCHLNNDQFQPLTEGALSQGASLW